jgi:hypothetical protein
MFIESVKNVLIQVSIHGLLKWNVTMISPFLSEGANMLYLEAVVKNSGGNL